MTESLLVRTTNQGLGRVGSDVWGIPWLKRIRRFVVTVGGVDNVDKPTFPAGVNKNGIPKPVEELSTYPHWSWITAGFDKILGMERSLLRRPSTGSRFAPISPTGFTRIIHNVGDLSTEKRRLSPEGVESSVLWSPYTLFKRTRTYYAFVGNAGE